MPLATREYDATRYLDSEEAIAAYIADATASGDANELAHALGVVARAKGMSDLSRQTGLSRQTLYKALSGESNLNWVPSPRLPMRSVTGFRSSQNHLRL